MLLIPFFSGKVVAIGPPPNFQWAVGEPFSPVGFFSIGTRTSDEGHTVTVFTMLNGTSASFKLKITPDDLAYKFPINMTLQVHTSFDAQPKDVSIALSQNFTIFKSKEDSFNLTVTLITKSNASEGTHRLGIGKVYDAGSSESGPLFIDVNILKGYQATITTTSTTTSTFEKTISTTITNTASTTMTETVTLTSPIGEVEFSILTWAVGATIIVAVFAIVLLRRNQPSKKP